jgi:hypothetical protein
MKEIRRIKRIRRITTTTTPTRQQVLPIEEEQLNRITGITTTHQI